MAKSKYFLILLVLTFRECAGCVMPEEIPPAFLPYYTQRSWNALRMRQQAQILRNGGCPDDENQLPCEVQSESFEDTIGECRNIEGVPMCVVSDPSRSRYSMMWPAHSDCGPVRRGSGSRRFQRPRVMMVDDVVAAKERAIGGSLPANVDSEGREVPLTRCRVRQRSHQSLHGRCTKLNNEVYGCRANSVLHLLHPTCAYLKTDNE